MSLTKKRKQTQIPPSKPSSIESTKKKIKFTERVIEEENVENVGEWFDLLHSKNNSTITKLERGSIIENISFFYGNVWDAIKDDFPTKITEKGKGPIALIIASSADRCCELIKELSKSPSGKTIAKLFARHMKVKDQKVFLKTKPIGCAIGTPNRILKLFEDESSLKLDLLKYVIVDMKPDSKNFTLLNAPEISNDFFSFYRKALVPLTQSVKYIVLKEKKIE